MLRRGLIVLGLLLLAAPASAGTLRSVSGVRAPLAAGCPAAAMVVVYPKQMPLFLAPPRGKALLRTSTGLGVSVQRVEVTKCSSDELLRSVSLFGSIKAQQVRLLGAKVFVAGLQVGTRAAVGSRFPLGWGTLVVDEVTPTYIAALSLTLSRDHDGLKAGTKILVGVGPVPPKPKKKRPKASHLPLKVTPRLQVHKLVFPVASDIGVGDSYGGPRSDVKHGWHHGDDLFAPLGTPVVAVASGTVNRVGWERIGGWRLWVRDTAGDQFYYAHLSGYAPGVLRSKKVTRGEVIGFVGNTGDAYTTPPHLHFEVHPRKLLHLGYDGAVDPTTYLEAWPRVRAGAVPHPAHPRLPRELQPRTQASHDWHELLMARHLLPRWKPRPAFDAGAVAALRRFPPVVARGGSSSSWPVVAAGLGLVGLLGAAGALAYRQKTRNDRV